MVGRGACGRVSHWWDMAGAVRLEARAPGGQGVMGVGGPEHQGLTQHDLTAQGSPRPTEDGTGLGARPGA